MRFVIFTVLGLLSACSNSDTNDKNQDRLRQTTSDAAADMVHNAQIGSNLPGIALGVAKATHTYGMADKAKLDSAITALEPKYRPAWDAALANCYRALLSENELRSLAENGKTSPYAARFQSVSSTVSTCMHDNATATVTGLATEALSAAAK